MNKLQDLSMLPIFQCKFCTRRLQYPVVQVKHFGNICESCYERSAFTDITYNIELQESLIKLYFPCNYRDHGCFFIGPFLETCSHENKCKFKDKICPFAYEDECEYTLRFNIIEHIYKMHKDRVLITSNNIIEVENPVLPKRDIFYIISNTYQHFLLRIKFDAKNQLMLYLFYYFDNDDCNNFTLFVKNENFILCCRSLNALHESELNSSFDRNRALKIKLSLLDSISRKIKFVVNYEENRTQDELKAFECPLCFNYMLAEIYMCSRGHTICHECKMTLANCPSCKSYFAARNYSLESLSQVYKFPCKNRGCNKYTKGIEYDLHDDICFFTTYNCPYHHYSRWCTWMGLYKDIPEHLRRTHRELVVHRNGDSLNIWKEPRNKYITCFILQENILIFEYEYDNRRLYLTTGLINPNLYKNLIWEIHIENEKNSDKIILIESCVGYKNASEKAIVVTEEKLKLTVHIKYVNK